MQTCIVVPIAKGHNLRTAQSGHPETKSHQSCLFNFSSTFAGPPLPQPAGHCVGLIYSSVASETNFRLELRAEVPAVNLC